MSDGEAETLRSTFPSYMAEGERLYLCGNYSKAAQSFSNALHLQSGDKNCLVARSKCYLKMGDLEKSLNDAEASLQSDPTFCKGILQKAETLYTMGDFEFALVFYHRGYKLRPDREFKVGIQKAQEAINNSVGSPSSIKLENKGDLSFLSKQAESKKAQQKPPPVKPLLHNTKHETKRKGSLKSDKTVRQLLGELYVDKEYLEKLLLDEDLIKGTIKGGLTVEDLIMTGINYLDTRSNFWRQQKPIYARERDRKLMQEKWLRDRKRSPSQTAHYILKSLEDIDMLLTSGSAEGSLQKAEKVLKKVLEWNKDEVPNKDELVGNLYSCIGNAQIELGQMVAALQSHRKDLEIAKEYDLPDAKSRALDNIGRVFARVGKFQQAIDTWEEKIPLAKGTLEKTWLFHEIGRCYLELDQAWQAQSYGEKSQQYAEEEGDLEWQLNASILVAQAQVKLRDFESAVNNFEKALERAKLVHNNEAQQAIISALDDANKGIIEELKKTNYREILREKAEKLISGDEPKEKLDLVSYFGKRPPGVLHCTTKFCDYGKAAGAEEYAQQDVVKRSYSKAFKLSISALFVTPKTVGAQVVLNEQQLLLWPSDVDKPSSSESLPAGSRAHITLGCAADVQPVQTGLDLLEILQQEKGGSRGEEVGELPRGKLYSLGKGRWMLTLAKKMEVKTIFTGYYGKGKPVPTHGSRKGGAMQICTII